MTAKRKKKSRKKPRCLRCDRVFKPKSEFNRLCVPCNRYATHGICTWGAFDGHGAVECETQ